MALPAYTMNGIYKELQKQFGSNVQNYIIAARTAQGYEELAASTEQQRLDIVKRWQATQLELHKEKQRIKHAGPTPPNCVFLRVKNAAHSSLEERRKHAKNGRLHKAPTQAKRGSSARRKSEEMAAGPQPLVSGDSLAHADTATFEEAIQSSVKATSRGDPQEDALIERAIRASVLELRKASRTGDSEEAIQRAIQASVAEAAQAKKANPVGSESDSPDADDGLRLSLQRSLSYHPSAEVHADDEPDDSGVETGYEDDVASATPPKANQSETGDDDAHFHKAMEQSRLDHEQKLKDLEKERTEEEIVLEYIKKQSLREEEHRRSLASKASATPK